MAWMEKLMMQVALVDQVTKPLAGINAQIDKVSKAGRQGWSNMAMGATTLAAGDPVELATRTLRLPGDVPALEVGDAVVILGRGSHVVARIDDRTTSVLTRVTLVTTADADLVPR